MPKTKEQKQQIIEDVKENFQKTKAAVLLDFSGVDSTSLFALRAKLNEAGCLLKVIKKTLLEKALENLGKSRLSKKIGEIKAQTALVFGFEDELAPSKLCYQFSIKNKNLKILGGIFGEDFFEREKVIELAELPSKPELLSRLAGLLQNTVSSIAYVLGNNIKGLIYLLNAVKSKCSNPPEGKQTSYRAGNVQSNPKSQCSKLSLDIK